MLKGEGGFNERWLFILSLTCSPYPIKWKRKWRQGCRNRTQTLVEIKCWSVPVFGSNFVIWASWMTDKWRSDLQKMEDWVVETPVMYCASRLATTRFIYLSVCQMAICLHFKLIKTGVQKPRMHMINTSFHRKFEKWNSKNFLLFSWRWWE